jgi:hypothetical protein
VLLGTLASLLTTTRLAVLLGTLASLLTTTRLAVLLRHVTSLAATDLTNIPATLFFLNLAPINGLLVIRTDVNVLQLGARSDRIYRAWRKSGKSTTTVASALSTRVGLSGSCHTIN